MGWRKHHSFAWIKQETEPVDVALLFVHGISHFSNYRCFDGWFFEEGYIKNLLPHQRHSAGNCVFGMLIRHSFRKQQ